jgi:hypothetical protein
LVNIWKYYFPLYKTDHAVKFGNNLRLMADALREIERESKHEVLNPGPRLILRNQELR